MLFRGRVDITGGATVWGTEVYLDGPWVVVRMPHSLDADTIKERSTAGITSFVPSDMDRWEAIQSAAYPADRVECIEWLEDGVPRR